MQKKKTWLVFGLVILNLAIIWGNSLLPATESAKISGGFLSKLLELLPVLGGLTEFLLRKLAHFSEFALLGFLLMTLFLQLGQKRPANVLLCGVLAAMTDETIQMFSPGRSCEVRDVWIDTSGVMTGILVCLCILFLWSKRKGK